MLFLERHYIIYCKVVMEQKDEKNEGVIRLEIFIPTLHSFLYL